MGYFSPLTDNYYLCIINVKEYLINPSTSSLLEQARERNVNLAPKLIKSFVSFCSSDSSFLPNVSDPLSLFNSDEIEYFNSCGVSSNRNDTHSEPILPRDSPSSSISNSNSNSMPVCFESLSKTLLQNLRSSMPRKTKKKSDFIPDQADLNLAEYKRLTGSHIVSSFILHYRQNLPNALEPLWKQIIDIPQLNQNLVSDELYSQFSIGYHSYINFGFEVIFRVRNRSYALFELTNHNTSLSIKLHSRIVIGQFKQC